MLHETKIKGCQACNDREFSVFGTFLGFFPSSSSSSSWCWIYPSGTFYRWCFSFHLRFLPASPALLFKYFKFYFWFCHSLFRSQALPLFSTIVSFVLMQFMCMIVCAWFSLYSQPYNRCVCVCMCFCCFYYYFTVVSLAAGGSLSHSLTLSHTLILFTERKK